MGRMSPWALLARTVAVIAAVVLLGVLTKIIGGIFVGVLPPALVLGLAAGWQELYGLVDGAVGPIVGLLILVTAVYIAIGGRR